MLLVNLSAHIQWTMSKWTSSQAFQKATASRSSSWYLTHLLGFVLKNLCSPSPLRVLVELSSMSSAFSVPRRPFSHVGSRLRVQQQHRHIDGRAIRDEVIFLFVSPLVLSRPSGTCDSNSRKYLVRWHKQGPNQGYSWVAAADFEDTATIQQQYWRLRI